MDTIEDTMYELSEDFTLTLSNISGSASFADSSGTGTITNDDGGLQWYITTVYTGSE
ncbi:MAG: hypothetical protein H6765_10225 [Candidatus Peribacteria bacterium]|nr:MAG: hypothetical protein H6765_10225 [Candidatus Peribacteria bacterium]